VLRTVGDLLQAVVEAERRKLAEYSYVNHPGLIGEMYEGLARHLAQRALAPPANLRVVKGKIRNSKGQLSRQIDCMIVEGDGEQLPYTDQWIYDVANVLAAIEVKKSLYADDLMDALDLMADLQRRICEPREMLANLLIHSWRSIHRSELPSKNELARLSQAEQLLYHSLVVEANLPLRIVIGFEGYASESALRNALVNLLTARVKRGGGAGIPLGPVALPSLILCRDASLIKLNGMPYSAPYWPAEGAWGFLGSRGVKPAHAFLELLWTRLTYYYGAPHSIFGEDLEVEAINLLFKGRPIPHGTDLGWALDVIDATEMELAEGVSDRPWEPAVLSKAAFVVVNELCRERPVTLTDPDLIRFLQSEGMMPETLLEELNRARLAYAKDSKLFLLTDECGCVIVPGVGFVAAENRDGRLERWLLRRLRERE
jgi:hypothetical protein